MAEYFESVQWAVRPVTAHRFEEHLGEELPVNCGPITEVEVRRAAKRLEQSRMWLGQRAGGVLEGTLLYSGTGGDMGNGILQVVLGRESRA